MSRPLQIVSEAMVANATHCWNKIGVRGDSSCDKLERHIHCRNCPVYSAAAVGMLDVPPPRDYLAHWTQQVAQGRELAAIDTLSVVVFRTGTEWFALSTSVLKEIVSVRAIHSVPHRRNGVILGLANVRGELLVCFSLQHVLALEQVTEVKRDKQHVAAGRLLVMERDGSRAACPVDEVHGIAHFHSGEVTPAPSTIAKAEIAYTTSVLSWQTRSVALLDDKLLFKAVNRNLA